MKKKKGKDVYQKKLIETLCESNINNFVEEHFSSENIFILVLLPMK